MKFEQVGNAFHLGILAFVCAGAFANGVIAAVLYRRTKNKYRNYVSTTGVVSEVVRENSAEGPIIRPVIRFTTGAKYYEFKSPLGRSSWDIKSGDIVPIIYDPMNPTEAEIENRFFQYLLPIFFAAGCFFALCCLPIIYFQARS